MVFKNKFTALPQCDSEGFLDTAAPCRGCSHDEMCPRSGHCERYDSPLRASGSAFWTDSTGKRHQVPTYGGGEITPPRVRAFIDEVELPDVALPNLDYTNPRLRITRDRGIVVEDGVVVTATVNTFDGETGTYSDPKCSLCPWSMLDDDHLERIHKLWRDSDASQRAQLHALLDQARTRGL